MWTPTRAGILAMLVGAAATLVVAPSTAADVCDFYETKLEATLKCGANGYPLGYGRRYCERFRDLKNLSPAGMKWRDDTLACLQQKLKKYASNGGDCDVVQKEAFASHGPCYVKSNFCELPTSDWGRIFQTIDWTDLFSGDGLIQIGKTLRDCYQKKINSKQLDPNSAEAKGLLKIISALENGEVPIA